MESVMKSECASIDLAGANTGYFEKKFFSLGCITIDCAHNLLYFILIVKIIKNVGLDRVQHLQGMNGTVAQYYNNINLSFLEPRSKLNDLIITR